MPPRPRRASSADLLEAVGRRIVALRKDRGLTQARLAEKIGIREQSLGRAENGKAALGLERLHELAVALGCSVSDLVVDIDTEIPKSPWPAEDVEASDTWRRIPKRRRALALKVLKQFE